MSKSPRHFLDLFDVPTRDLRTILDASMAMKKKRKAGDISDKPLDGKTLAMIFDKPSTRTRVSFDVAMRQLGGETLFLSGAECSSAARRRSPIRRASCRATSTRS